MHVHVCEAGVTGADDGSTLLTVLRRILNHRMSVEALIEIVLWVAMPYLTIGMVWAAVHPGQMEQFATTLEVRLPQGIDVIAFAQIVVLWPLLAISPHLCGS
jgi:hypothetical protein